jgi:MoaA/NifB/PqqE/SkfB family radical SAM enzyme
MLEEVLSVGWSAEDGIWCALPQGGLPRELEWLRVPENASEIVNRVACPCHFNGGKHDALSLGVNLAYREERRILLERPMMFCLRRGVLLWDGADEAQRALRLQPSETFAPRMESTGVRMRLRRPPIGGELSRWFRVKYGNQNDASDPETGIAWRLALAGKDYGEQYVDGEAHEREGVTDFGLRLPDGLCFHTNNMPPQLTIMIEPTTRCNFRCGFCVGRHIEQGNLEFEDLVAILDRLPKIDAVQLVGEGEPLVHARFFDLLREVKRRGVWVHVTTNGSLLDEANRERLFAEGLDSLAVSLESLRPERFRQIRERGEIDVVRENLTRLMQRKRMLGAGMQVGLWVSVLSETLDELGDIVAFNEELGLDFLEVQPLNSMNTYSKYYDEFFTRNLTCTELFAERMRHETRLGVRNLLEQLVSFGNGGTRCEVFFGSLQAMWDGSVTPCSMIKTPLFASLGDLRLESFETIWEKPRFRAFRFALQHGMVFASCEGCAVVAHVPGLRDQAATGKASTPILFLESQLVTTIRPAEMESVTVREPG